MRWTKTNCGGLSIRVPLTYLSGVDADRDASQTMVPDWLRDLNRKTSRG
jgi:hypothetical protein